MGRRVVAAEREADAEEADHQLDVVCAKAGEGEEDGEDHHLDDEHRLPPKDVGEAAEDQRPDQNAEETRRADDALFKTAEAELTGDERQRDAGHEDDKPLEEFAGRRKAPDQPLHAGHRRRGKVGSIGPDRQLVDMVLHSPAGRARRRPRCMLKRRVGHLLIVLCEGSPGQLRPQMTRT